MSTTAQRRKKTGSVEATGEHPLVHQIPPASILDDYVNRNVYNVEDFAFLDYCMKAKRNVMFIGDTQCGKTMMVSAFGAARGLPVVTINANGGIDPNTFFGMLRPDGDGEWKWQWSEIAMVIEHGGILFVDEVNFMLPRVASVLHPLADSRRQVTVIEQWNKVIKAHDNFLLVTAHNQGYEGTRPLNEAFKARFLPVELDYDDHVEEELLCMPVTREIAERLRSARNDGTISSPVGTGMLVNFEEMAADISVDAAISCFLARFDPTDKKSVAEVFELSKEEIVRQTAEMIAPD